MAFKIRYIILIITFTVGCICCNDEIAESKKDYSISLLPVAITSEGEISTTITEYGYDEYNRIITLEKKEIYRSGNIRNELLFEIIYNEANDIAKTVKTLVNITDGIETVDFRDTLYFEYNANNIKIIEHGYISNITVNNKKQILEMRQFADNNIIRYIEKYEYDDKGNISGYYLNNGTQFISDKYSAQYDNANGIFKNIQTPQWFLVAVLCENWNLLNNRIFEILSSENAAPVNLFVHYTYNEYGYPVEETYYPEGYSITVDAPVIRIEYAIIRKPVF